LNPRDGEYHSSGYISTNYNAAEVAKQVNWYYNSNFSCSANVYIEDFDINGLPTNVSSNVYTRNITITLDKLIWGTTADAILVAKMSTFSEFEVYTPDLI